MTYEPFPDPTAPIAIRLSARYEGGPETAAWLQACSDELTQGTLSLDTARGLALNRNALIAPDEAWAAVWNMLEAHYREQGLEPVVTFTRRREQDLLAAVVCDRFGVPVDVAVREHAAGGQAEILEPYRIHAYGPLAVYFSTFIEGCQRVPLVAEIAKWQAELDAERANPTYDGLRHGRMTDLKQRVDALSGQLYSSEIGSLREPDRAILEAFGKTATAQAFIDGSAFELPDLGIPPQIGISEARHAEQLYSLDRIMQPRAQ
jgi:hypothetical protein